MDRKFIIDNQEVTIPASEIKNYQLFPECYFKGESEILPFPGKVYLSQDGDFCNGLDCSIKVPSDLMNAQGSPLSYENQNLINEESSMGFIYEGKLYMIDQLEEIYY